MNKSQIERIIAELIALRAEVAIQTDAAREVQAVLLAIASPKQSGMEWIREQGISMWGPA